MSETPKAVFLSYASPSVTRGSMEGRQDAEAIINDPKNNRPLF